MTNLVGTFVIDGTLMSYDGSQILTPENNRDDLRRQLLLYGSIISSNTVGGSLGTTQECPYGSDVEKQGGECAQEDAEKYDFAALRTFRLNYNDLTVKSDSTVAIAEICHYDHQSAPDTRSGNPRGVVPQTHGDE